MTEEQQELVYSEFEEDLRKSAELLTAERKGIKKGLEKAEKKARAEKEQIIRNLFAMKMTTADIAKVVNLPEEEVAKLRQ